MTYKLSSPYIGAQPLNVTSTTQNHALGTIVRGVDDGATPSTSSQSQGGTSQGEGEFIYLLGVASTAVGSVVTYDPSTYQTTLCAVGGNIPRPIAIAMSANVASQYGWYQIGGVATVKKTCTISLAAGAAVGVLTTGLIAGTGSGKEIDGAAVAAVASAAASRTTVRVMLQRPTKQGRVT